MHFKQVYESSPKETKFFLGVYVLYNWPYFVDDVSRERNHESDKFPDLEDEIEKFLNISINASHCLENFVDKKRES